MNWQRSERARYFFFAFSIAFFILSLMLLFLIVMVPPRPAATSMAAQNGSFETESDYLPTAEEAISVLLIGVSGDGRDAGTFLLARFDPARRSIPLVSLPPDTALEHNGRLETLTEIYHYGGAEYTKDTLAVSLQIAIDRYVRMDEAAFLLCANAVGSVEFTLEEPVAVESGGMEMTLQAGAQLLDGQRVAALLAGGDLDSRKRSRMVGELAAAVANQRLDICQSTLVDKVFSVIINAVDTDISYMDYQNRKQAGEYLSKLGGEPAISIAPSGTGEDGQYQLSDTFLALLRQTFS